MDLFSHNHEETLEIGKRLGKYLQPGDIVLLYGDLGVGKTTLTQGICRGLDIKEDTYIPSPTFTLINNYCGKYPVFHVDLYRLDSLLEIEKIGLEECLFTNGVCIIEWAEKLSPKPNQPPSLGIYQRIEIHITIEKENRRNFRVNLINQEKRPAFQ